MDISQTVSLSSVFLSLLMGLVSFASPCILPLIPSYVSYITGVSFDELVSRESRLKNVKTTLLHSVAFVIGFSFIFVLLGATASLAGQLLTKHLNTIRVLGGALMILLGLFVIDILKIPFLERETKLHLKTRPTGYLGTFIVGIVFGAGWTPCTGPFLGAALVQAAQTSTMATGMTLLAFYSLGLGIPFILSAVAITVFLSSFRKVKEYLRTIKVASGSILILMGALLITNKMTLITSYTLELWERLKNLW